MRCSQFSDRWLRSKIGLYPVHYSFRCMFFKPEDPEAPIGIINSCDVPRSIFWISSISEDGVVNASPWSFSGAIAYHPPQVYFSVTGKHKSGREKDTLVNVRDTREFVVNFPTYETREQMNITCASVDPDVDEMKLAGLETVASTLVTPPGINVSPIRLECELYKIIPLRGDKNTLVIGEVVGYHIQDQFMRDGKVDWLAYKPIGRMGRPDGYAVIDNIFFMDRPK